MSKRILSLFPGILFSSFLLAQGGILKGKISDGKTAEALGGVSIYVDGKGIATSAADGTYELPVAAGTHKVECKFVGYTPFSQSIDIKESETQVLDISLSMAATELGVIVISAGKFEQKLEEVTVSMDVVKGDLIHNKNTTSVDNIMDQCPGVNILDGQANIRGGSGFSYGAGTRVLVLVDDLPILTADAGDVKWNFIPVENIEQVEIIKGASSALFGSSAMNGVINFRTSYPKDTAHTSVNVSTGFYDKPKRDELVWWKNGAPAFSNTSFLHSRQIGSFDLVLGGNAFADEGYRRLEIEKRYRFNFGTRYRFQNVPGLSIGLNGNHMSTEGGYFILWQNADSAYYPQGGTVSDYHTIRTTLDPYLTYYTSNGHRHSLRTRYYNATNLNNTNQESVSRVWYGEYQYQLHLKKDLTITSGLTGTYSDIISDSLYGRHFSSNIGLFTQLDKKFDRLTLSFGARGEYFKVDTAETKTSLIIGKDTTILPVHPVFRAGMNYRLLTHTWVRASFGQGYRFPSVAEKFISTHVSGLTIYPNPEIQPESGWSAEIGAKQAFKISGWKGFLDVAAFRQEYRNMMEFTFDYWVPPGTPNATNPFVMLPYFGAKSINVGRARITGTELTVAGEGTIGNVNVTLMGGYTYILPVDLDYDSATTKGSYDGNILKYRYEHTAKFDIELEYRKCTMGISMRYNSFMKNIDQSFQQELFNDVIPSYHSNVYILPGLQQYREEHNKGDVVFDYRVSYRVTPEVRCSVVINNVFNQETMGRPGDVQPPRSFAFMVSVKI